jgi:hypothetical protein
LSKKTRTEISIETDQVVIIRRQHVAQQWCAVCAMHTHMITAEAAAAATGLSRRSVYRLVEQGQVHFCETSDGLLLICLNSLPLQFNQPFKGE